MFRKILIMTSGTLLLSLIGFACLYAQSYGTNQTKNAKLMAIDTNLALAIESANQSNVVADKISATLRHIQPDLRRPSVLHNECADSCINYATSLVSDAIISSKRYAENDMQNLDPDIHVSRLIDTKVTLLEFEYPEILKSDTQQRGTLTVMIWLCPDRTTAMALFWLRRGGRILYDNKELTVVEPDSRCTLNIDPGNPGEIAYKYISNLMINIPLKKNDPLALPDRVGYLADNLIVEVETQTFFRESSDSDWVTIGMSDTDKSEAFDVLHHIDGDLQGEEK